MTDLLIIGLFLFAWIALVRWILPALGIPTCCCGDSCRVPTKRSVLPAPEPTGGETGPAEKVL